MIDPRTPNPVSETMAAYLWNTSCDAAPIPTSITLGATRLEIVQGAIYPYRQPILITLGHEEDGRLSLTLDTTAPEEPEALEYLGNLLSTLGAGLTARAHNLIPDDAQEADQ